MCVVMLAVKNLHMQCTLIHSQIYLLCSCELFIQMHSIFWFDIFGAHFSRVAPLMLISPGKYEAELELQSYLAPFYLSFLLKSPLGLSFSPDGLMNFAFFSRSANGAVENQLKEKAICSVEAEERGVNGIQHVGFPGLLSKKKMLVKEEVGDGDRKQGRSGRGSVFHSGRMPLSGDKLDSSAAAKPVRAMKPTSEKNGSKSGRPPLKKHLERKGFTRLALVPNENSPDCTVESEDDREDLFAAAQLACNTSCMMPASLWGSLFISVYI